MEVAKAPKERKDPPKQQRQHPRNQVPNGWIANMQSIYSSLGRFKKDFN